MPNKSKKAKIDDYLLNTISDKWIDKGTFYVYQNLEYIYSDKIAAFDLDGTLITTKSGKVFPKDENDWCLWGSKHELLKSKIIESHQQGYRIVIFSNQRGILKQDMTLGKFKSKIESVVKCLVGDSISCTVLFATGNDYYRKPLPGMWEYIEENANSPISRLDSFFVGDAAGRDKSHNRKKKDFSASDRLFAINLGLGKFYTPEEFFYDLPTEPFIMPAFDPKNFIIQPPTSLLNPTNAEIWAQHREMIIMVGYPASGKSHFVQNKLVNPQATTTQNGESPDVAKHPKYIRINMDTLKTRAKCENTCRDVLSTKGIQGDNKMTSIVIDNTNPDRASRKIYLDMARQFKVPVRCFLMQTTFDQCIHNERYRRLVGTEGKAKSSVPESVFHIYKSKFQEPSFVEGIKEIIRVAFIPNFKDEEQKKLYSLYQ